MYCPKSMLLVEISRRRLRNHLQKRRKQRPRFANPFSAPGREKLTTKSQEFYTEGIADLLEARRSIAEYSLPRLDFRYTALLA